ncbi:hypothetical protein LINGRAHAP2_LOCUS22545, partial [Linum grandiflorum]
KDAQRILFQDKRRFNGIDNLLGYWIKDAGRSVVMSEFEVAWIRVRGIPLHLRSKEFYRRIIEWCGGFIRSDESANLAWVRIKVKATGDIPEEIPLCCGEEVFSVGIEIDQCAECGSKEAGPTSSKRVFF